MTSYRFPCLILLVSLLVWGLSSCRSKKELVKSPQTEESCFPYQTLTCYKGTLAYRKEGKNLSANLQLYIDKKEVCYFQATVLFVEVARGVVYQDSFFILNRLERTCLQGSNLSLENTYGFKVSPSALFTLFTGNYCPTSLSQDFGIKPSVLSDTRLLYTISDNRQAEIVRSEYPESISEIEIREGSPLNPLAKIVFSPSTLLESHHLPSQITIEGYQAKKWKGSITLRLQNFAFDVQKDINFVIPNNYKRQNLSF